MDPTANLKEQLALANQIVTAHNAGEDVHEADVDRLAELVLALDAWVRGGGFLPAAWQRGE